MNTYSRCDTSGSGSSSKTSSSQNFSLERATNGLTKEISCPLCAYVNTNVKVIENHVQSHFDIADDPFPQTNPDVSCPFCHAMFFKLEKLQQHLNEQHRDVVSARKKQPNLEEEINTNICPVCKLYSETYEELLHHVESHFSPRDQSNTADDYSMAERILKHEKENCRALEEKELRDLKAEYGMIDNGNFREQSLTNMQKAVCSGKLAVSDFYRRQSEIKMAESLGIDDNTSCVRSVLPRIREKSANCFNVTNTLLCSDVDYYSSTFGDRGWGCGYRNLQMLLSSLFRNQTYSKILSQQLGSRFRLQEFPFGIPMPSISKLQEIIESAWNQGFDAEGRDQLAGKLRSTRKWIGATEITTVLSSMRFRCQLVDIERPSANGLHLKLFEWIIKYFEKSDPFKPPLYLQHQGHSRTVVGVEMLRNGNPILLILDPSTGSQKLSQMLNDCNSDNSLKLLRKTFHDLKHNQYQIVTVAGVMETEAEYQASKIQRSLKLW